MTLLIYSLLAGAVLTALWLTWRLLGMQRLTHFELNRWLLVLTLLLSLLLPLLAFRPLGPLGPVGQVGQVRQVGQVEPVEFVEFTEAAPTMDFSWLPTVYLIGIGVCALWTLVGLIGVVLALIGGRRSGELIIHKGNVAPFAWGRWIVVSERDAEIPAILLHESAHLRAGHWLDLLLSRLIVCILWYWPTAWLLARDLVAQHEFEADRSVLDEGISPAGYQKLLVNVERGSKYPEIVNPFNYYSLKKRIIMMKKKSSSTGSCMRALVMLPAVAALVLLTSTPSFAARVQSYVTKDDNASSKEAVFHEAEVQPQFPGGEAEMYHWLSRNVRYPENAAKNNVQGRVIAQFVVEKDGSVGEVKVIRGVDPELDAETVRLFKSLPKFIPGTMDGKPVRVWFTLPLTFKLAPSDEKSVPTPQAKDIDAGDVTQAEFPGGEAEMWQFVARNIRYPEADAVAGKSGQVTLKVLIEKDGSVGDIKVENNTGTETMAQEAIRVTKLMPKFKPATNKGQAVGQWITLPYSFKLN